MKKFTFILISMLLLASCTINLSKKDPFIQAVGKQFILQRDLYIYSFNDYGKYAFTSLPCKLCLGTKSTLAGTFGYGLSDTVEEKYIGSKNDYITLEGVLHKGNLITIKRIVEQKTLDISYFLYLVSPNEGPFAGQEIDPSDITTPVHNPPYTANWSDPPIFKPQYALPLPSDGIWWK